jgi:hypothetical protein
VSAATLGETIKGKLSGPVSEATQGTVAKILLMLLVVLLVYSIFSFIPIFPKDNPYIQWGVSIIVGILSFVFVSTENIKYILANYEALGIMLTTIIPLVILIVFTTQMRKSGFEYAGLINKVLILGYAIYVGVRWASITWNLDTSKPVPELAWLYPLTIVGLIIWLIIEKWVWYKFLKAAASGGMDEAKKVMVSRYESEISRLTREVNDAKSAESKEILIKEFNRTAADARKWGLSVKDWGTM